MWFKSLSIPQLALCFVSQVLAVELYPQITPRSNPVTIPIHARSRRDVAVGNATNTTSGITALTESADKNSYFSIITTGNITFRVDLDTASSDLWILSSDCQTETCKQVPRYPLTYQSPSFSEVNGNTTAFSAHYADGTSVKGFVAREAVSIAGFTLVNQTFGLVTDSNVSLTEQASGILGLGFPRLSSISDSVTNSTPFFATLAQQGQLDYPLFALSLTRNSSGSLSLGAVDSSVVKNASKIGWNQVAQFEPFGVETNVSSYLQWAIPISGFSINGTQMAPMPTYPLQTKNISLALFDIGSPGIYGPFQDVSRLFAQIDGARLVDQSGQYVVPCDITLPMALTFGEQNYTLQPSDYLIGPASGNPNLCLTWPVALPPSSDGLDWQIGAAFLRTVYSIFSFGINQREPPLIGLYPLVNGTNITETPDSISSLFSSISATVATTLPNFIVPTPTLTTPLYTFNTSVSASVGGIVSTGLATSTYSALFGTKTSFNASALPTISLAPTVVTLIITNPSGIITTSVSTHSEPAVTLGVPPGWNAGNSLQASYLTMTFAFVSVLSTLLSFTDFFI